MNDSRPSEHRDDKPFTAAAEYGRNHLGWADDKEPEPDTESEAFAKKVAAEGWLRGFERPDVQASVTGTFADIAQVYATLYLAEQQRLANLIAFEVISGEKNRAEIRKGLGL
ncbi:MAG: hypothetical protein ABI067_17830 [Leifsonia sp.]